MTYRATSVPSAVPCRSALRKCSDLLQLLRPSLVMSPERWAGTDAPPAVDGLTRREVEVLTWVARGKTNQEIATSLVVSPNTVRKHLENAFEKLGVHTRAEAVAHLLSAPDA